VDPDRLLLVRLPEVVLELDRLLLVRLPEAVLDPDRLLLVRLPEELLEPDRLLEVRLPEELLEPDRLLLVLAVLDEVLPSPELLLEPSPSSDASPSATPSAASLSAASLSAVALSGVSVPTPLPDRYRSSSRSAVADPSSMVPCSVVPVRTPTGSSSSVQQPASASAAARPSPGSRRPIQRDRGDFGRVDIETSRRTKSGR